MPKCIGSMSMANAICSDNFWKRERRQRRIDLGVDEKFLTHFMENEQYEMMRRIALTRDPKMANEAIRCLLYGPRALDDVSELIERLLDACSVTDPLSSDTFLQSFVDIDSDPSFIFDVASALKRTDGTSTMDIGWRLFKIAGQRGHAGAALHVARERKHGLAFDAALRSYRRAAEHGCRKSFRAIAKICVAGKSSRGVDLDEASRCFTEAARIGDVKATRELARMHQLGEVVSSDSMEEAARLYRSAADAGDSLARCALAVMMSRRKVRETDQKERERLVLSLKTNPTGLFRLGARCDYGRGRWRDVDMAHLFYAIGMPTADVVFSCFNFAWFKMRKTLTMRDGSCCALSHPPDDATVQGLLLEYGHCRDPKYLEEALAHYESGVTRGDEIALVARVLLLRFMGRPSSLAIQELDSVALKGCDIAMLCVEALRSLDVHRLPTHIIDLEELCGRFDYTHPWL